METNLRAAAHTNVEDTIDIFSEFFFPGVKDTTYTDLGDALRRGPGYHILAHVDNDTDYDVVEIVAIPRGSGIYTQKTYK